MKRARDVAVAVLARVERDGAFAAAALTAELGRVRDRREAALATELVLGVLRRRPWLDHLLESASDRGLAGIDPGALRALRVAAYQIAFLERVPARAAVSEAVGQVRRSRAAGLAGLANALLRDLSRRDRSELAPPEEDDGAGPQVLAMRLGLPEWLLDRLVDARGREAALATARAFDIPSRRTLRVNAARAKRDEVLLDLGDRACPGRLSPWAVDVLDLGAAKNLEERGLAARQDEGAQLAVLALDPRPGDRVLDACAGRGGKTAAIAALLPEGADVVAADRSAGKLDRLALELERQGLAARAVAADLAAGPGAIDGSFDRILVDAPCSGTGTMGRRPEIRWRLEPGDLASLTRLQGALLETCAGLLSPGGRLVYSVCSVLPEEGGARVDDLLGRHPDLALTAEAPREWPGAVPWNLGRIDLDPAAHGTDGYAIHCLEKRG